MSNAPNVFPRHAENVYSYSSEIFQTPPEENSRWLENTTILMWKKWEQLDGWNSRRLDLRSLDVEPENLGAQGHCRVGPLPLFPFPLIATGAFHLLKHAREKNFCVHERLCLQQCWRGYDARKMSHGSYVVSRQEPKLHFHRGSSSDASKAPFLFLTHFFFFHLFFISSYVSSFIPFLYSPFFLFIVLVFNLVFEHSFSSLNIFRFLVCGACTLRGLTRTARLIR